MNFLKLKKQIAVFALVAMSITACKKNEVVLADAVNEANDSATLSARRIRTGGGGTGAVNTYYISPIGNDATGTGAIGSPWKTLYKATATVSVSGAVIHVNAGTYTETQQSVLKTGVSIEGDGVTSIIKSSFIDTYKGILALTSAVGTNGNQHISNLKFDGNNLTNPNGIEIQGRSNVSVNNCTIINFQHSGIILNGAASYTGVAPSIYATGNTIYNNIINNCAGYNGFGDGCIQIGGQQGLLIYNNTITQNSRPSGQNGWPIKYYSGGYLNDCKIYNNILTKVPYNNDGWTFCIELFHESGLEIYGNTIQGSLDLNYQTKGNYAYSVYIHDNKFSQPTLSNFQEDGIILEFGTEDAIVENNTFKNTGQCLYFVPRAGDVIKNITVRKNLGSNIGINSNPQSWFIHFSGNNTTAFTNVAIYNNTFSGATGISSPYFGFEFPFNNGGSEDNISIQNNILENISFNAVKFDGNTHVGLVTIKNNDFYNAGTISFNGSSSPTSYFNSGNTNINPLFAAGGFTLSAASPCVNTGVNVGMPYNGSAPDKGYAEF